MPEEITNDKNNALLENLLTIAKLHWPAARISEMEPQIVHVSYTQLTMPTKDEEESSGGSRS